MRNEIFLRDDNQVNLVWFVRVPATGARYSCSYERGFPDFRKGDDVRIIRPRNLEDDSGYGYLVGLHEKLRGKAASVWVNDEEQLEMDSLNPDTRSRSEANKPSRCVGNMTTPEFKNR